LQANDGLGSNQKIIEQLLDIDNETAGEDVNSFDMIKLLEKYKLGQEKGESYFKDKDYIFEHFLVNSLIEKTIPFVVNLSIWDAYCYLVLLFGVWKSVVILDIATNDSYNDEKFSDMTALICRNLFHGSFIQESVLKYLVNNNLSDFQSIQKIINS
ncbi:MAG: hypothetical protein RSB96_01710, partial [Oscillospiraceae bacterium]